MAKCFRIVKPQNTLMIGEKVDDFDDSSVHLGNLGDATERGVVVLHFESFAAKSIVLHALVVPSADSVKVRSFAKSLELLGGLVKIKKLLDAVIVLTNVVTMLKDAERSVDLVLETVLHFSLLNFLLIIINIHFFN